MTEITKNAITEVKKSIILMGGKLSDESMLIEASCANIDDIDEFIETCLEELKKEYTLTHTSNHPAVGRVWSCVKA